MMLLARGLIRAEEVRFQTGYPKSQTGFPKPEFGYIPNRIPNTRKRIYPKLVTRSTLHDTRYSKHVTRNPKRGMMTLFARGLILAEEVRDISLLASY
jgi:hypothetical protein